MRAARRDRRSHGAFLVHWFSVPILRGRTSYRVFHGEFPAACQSRITGLFQGCSLAGNAAYMPRSALTTRRPSYAPAGFGIVMNLGDWLRSIGLERYEVAFRENA